MINYKRGQTVEKKINHLNAIGREDPSKPG